MNFLGIDTSTTSALVRAESVGVVVRRPPLARGAFIGLTLRHGRGHMTRVCVWRMC